MFSGIGALPEPAIESHVVIGDPSSPLSAKGPEKKSHPRGKPLQSRFPKYHELFEEPQCVECLIGKQKKPILFKVTEPSSIPYRTPPACVCVECLIGKQKKPILFKVTDRVPYRTELIPRALKWRRTRTPPTRNLSPRIHRRPSGLPTALQEH
jgi:hypothetical protein